MVLLVRTALMMTLSPGSVRTISEALLAASVASATTIPISAFFKAGASFTPSRHSTYMLLLLQFLHDFIFVFCSKEIAIPIQS